MVARVGKVTRISGGIVPITANLERQLHEPIPSACQGPYWAMGEIEQQPRRQWTWLPSPRCSGHRALIRNGDLGAHMHRYIHTIMLIGAVSFIIVSCRSVTSTTTPSAKLDTPTAVATFAPTPTRLGTFNLTTEQAQEVTIFMEFIRAINAGQLDGALALLDEQVVGSDCDFQKISVILFNGKSEAAEWLRQRMADHDHLEVSRVLNENSDPNTGRHVVGVEYGRRTNDTLAKLGFVNGIKPKLRSKVIFNNESTRIGEFANGPGGGDPGVCRPEN